MSVSGRYKIPERVVHQRLGDEMVLLNLETGYYFGLNPTGARLWELISEGRGLEDAGPVLMAEYDVDESVLSVDLENLVGELLSRGLIDRVAG
ncbi:MAG: PqqD family protein [Acidobacteria bacterium]|nr:PqqD family protein [Acidobacteriota bacterium]MCW5967798.1 PqqD family protein [Blastocatellales bacterium]